MPVNFYDRWVLPPVLDLVMRQRQLGKYRHAVVAAASGRVLEVGVGSGLNFPLYGQQVDIVFGIDPSPRLLALARQRATALASEASGQRGNSMVRAHSASEDARERADDTRPKAGSSARAAAGVRVSLLQGSATAIPLADHSVDTVVMTWTLCSIPDPLAALREMRRVLKPGGRLRFVEHGLSPEPEVERWQHRLTPTWRHVAGGCHLDRKIDDLIRAAGFDLKELHTEYARGPRPMTYMYEGCAQPTA
jgi:ubiquinone/menaquinone biosynthesis C-methylase UbiE